MTGERAGVVIVGGGIGGVALSLALAQHGVESTVLEQAPAFGEIGAGLQLAPNALWVLEQLGVLDAVYATAVYPPQAILRSAIDGEKITGLDFGPAFRARYSYPYILAHRRDLHHALTTAAEDSGFVTLATDKTVISVHEGAGGRVVVTAADGRTIEADAAVGADGLHSVVRQYTLDDGPPVVCRDVAYRGTIPFDQISHHDTPDSMTWWVGPNMHLVQYPIRGGELYNQVAVFTSRRYTPDSDAWGGPDELEEAFAGKDPRVRQASLLINRDRWWTLSDRPGVESWSRGHVTLLGDAAHPMLQYVAQGACQALEDAIVLADCIADCKGDYGKAFVAYERERAPRAAEVQRWARLVGRIVHGDEVVALLRNALLKQRRDDDYTYVDWLYSYRCGR